MGRFQNFNKMKEKREMEEEFKKDVAGKNRLTVLKVKHFAKEWYEKFKTKKGIKAVVERAFLMKIAELADRIDEDMLSDERRELINAIRSVVKEYERIEGFLWTYDENWGKDDGK